MGLVARQKLRLGLCAISVFRGGVSLRERSQPPRGEAVLAEAAHLSLPSARNPCHHGRRLQPLQHGFSLQAALPERGRLPLYVTFRYKDYCRSGQARYRTMTLAADEFIRRFLLHVLPKGFHRIRHYGLLASASCKANIARASQLMAALMAEAGPPPVHVAAHSDAT